MVPPPCQAAPRRSWHTLCHGPLLSSYTTVATRRRASLSSNPHWEERLMLPAADLKILLLLPINNRIPHEEERLMRLAAGLKILLTAATAHQ
jgi:hypothetical protein